ncbi:mandelate racemase/muconate lactonizing enzyme family protein [Mycobacterium shimoidei]|uniref:Mandelate racemase/muconate lactonizing protein [Polaromonas sp. JS666] n=1 Tax=Mycobacterium shimoidei TaxID=29313 RepID=A0A1E3SZW9_MYCSH|nr:mandelate racemase/muconate lactonizing enzyme family protein [Mycobacterium shimoidei]MCV7261313.1 mandelate racemase/muconate lactonizing enzyme family protein [Mycobacterium shimoidei]ODR07657.1 L-alanine-DL-glutamate epimerase [Mycobacterium shimoidei]ORW83186.1 L-alanine-DL-glutamate epimerase [Mycobacterium shimoidei]SRX95827.1 mandelate racemase/muconate lactonizing protein [Polaromonas sp. JS666] [Mycobacterium shimoidei]
MTTTVIAKIETVPLRIPFRAGSTPGAALWGDKLSAADSLLVKVTTSDGVEGWGEAFGYGAVDSARLAVDELIAPVCVGQDATCIGPLMLKVQKKLHVLGRGGPVTYGLSAVDIALWDIAGKLANAPLCQLLGGGAPELPCYASLACYSEPTLVRAVVRQTLDAGFQAIKLHEADLAAIRAARAEAGPDVELIADVGCPWTLAQALAAADELKAVGLKFLEEPLWPPENFNGLAELRRMTGIPIASGENVSTLIEFERMLTVQAVDYVQPSPAKMGGVTELSKVFPLAATHNIPVMTHSFYDGPGLLAAVHTTAALGGPDAMIERRWFDLEASIYGAALTSNSGWISVPRGPGLGIDPDPDVLSAYRREI